LRAAGIALSWVGTGRLIFSLNYSEDDFAAVADRFVSAATSMQRDGWWWRAPELTNKSIRRRVLKEMIQARVTSASPIGSINSPRMR
jgi:glutamate-1-semialdehyde 2,1-aminomutase